MDGGIEGGEGVGPVGEDEGGGPVEGVREGEGEGEGAAAVGDSG